MKQYSTFIFDSYEFEPKEGKISLNYTLDSDISFTETLSIPPDNIKNTSSKALDTALQTLHLIGGISYFKTCCPKRIEVKSANLNKEQAKFWNTVYTSGLGEFFYRNEMDPAGNINFPNISDIEEKDTVGSEFSNVDSRVLVPIGGGKDSIVTIEKLRESGSDITLLRMGGHALIDEMVKVIDLPCITVKRSLSANLFTLNEEGALNGHIPITAYLSALCVVLSEIYGFDKIAMSNEVSANEGNLEYHGMLINHQWSKSEEFEQLFRKYIHEFIDPNLNYYSHLKKMNELEIVKEFSTYPQYFTHFTSCNKNWKIAGESLDGRWCGDCPKCAFVFSLFAAFLSEADLEKIFGKNLYKDEALIPLYKQLLGLEGFKPFECVGTPEETKEAFEKAHQKGELENTAIMKMFLENFSKTT